MSFLKYFAKKWAILCLWKISSRASVSRISSLMSIIISTLSRSIRDHYNWRNIHISLLLSINSILRVMPLCFYEHMSRFFPRIPIIISRNYKSRHHRAVHIIKHRVLRYLSFFTKPECVVIYYRENLRVILSPSHSGKTCKKYHEEHSWLAYRCRLLQR